MVIGPKLNFILAPLAVYIGKMLSFNQKCLTSVSLSLSHWYPGSGVVLDCIDS